MRQVVDVFRRAGKVDELADLGYLGVALGVLLDPVFQRLDVVVGHGFLSLHLGRLFGTEVGNQCIQFCHGRRRKSRNFCKMRVGCECLEPLDLNLETGANQAEFGKMLAQGIDLAGIAAIERGKCGQQIEGHGLILFVKPVILPGRPSPAPYAIIGIPKSESM